MSSVANSPTSPGRSRRPLRRGTALLPSLLTVGNLAFGWFSIQQSLHALRAAAPAGHLNAAALAIGGAVALDFMDGWVARLVNASSDFGREFDSLADIVSFGVAPALLAYIWGFDFLRGAPAAIGLIGRLAQILSFIYVVAGAARLARFNIAKSDSAPSNPGKPGKRYFVGMPIPVAAGALAAIVHFIASPVYFGTVNASLTGAVFWMVLELILAFFMVSTWRFYSLKGLDLGRRHPFVITLVLALIVAVLRFFSEIFLLALIVFYIGSALWWRGRYSWHRLRAH